VQEVHYQVKAVNFNVSRHCVYQTLRLVVNSGLATEIIPEDGSARLYTHELAIAQCSHVHLVCKDCGTAVEASSQNVP
jgi:Fe2+ or Zn2+ uptake regulation protein